MLKGPPDAAEILRSIVRDVDLTVGKAARAVADEAEAEVMATVHPLPGGGTIAIEPTRALTAIDVDVGERKGADAKRVTRQTNLVALGESARLLRLKGLGGLVIVDLAGRGHDGKALMAAARAAFGPDNPGVAIGPVGRFGTMELSIPRRTRPVGEVLCDDSGVPSDRSLAQQLMRRLEDEAQAQPGARLNAACSPAVARAAERLLPVLAQRFGARFALTATADLPRDRLGVSAA
jgi:Ribonuclease G/E